MKQLRGSNRSAHRTWTTTPGSPECVFGVLAAPVAQTTPCTLSLSVQTVAGRDDIAERGSVSRSTLRATDARDFSKRRAAGQAPAGHRPALLWLRLRRAGPYRRVALCQRSANHGAWDRSDALPITNRRYGRLSVSASLRRDRAEARGEGGKICATAFMAWSVDSLHSAGGPFLQPDHVLIVGRGNPTTYNQRV